MKNVVFAKQKKLYPFKVPCMSGRVKSRDSSTPVISLVGPGFERCSVHNLTILCTKGGVCSSSPPALDALGSTIAVSTDAISNGISTRIESQSSKVHLVSQSPVLSSFRMLPTVTCHDMQSTYSAISLHKNWAPLRTKHYC